MSYIKCRRNGKRNETELRKEENSSIKGREGDTGKLGRMGCVEKAGESVYIEGKREYKRVCVCLLVNQEGERVKGRRVMKRGHC